MEPEDQNSSSPPSLELPPPPVPVIPTVAPIPPFIPPIAPLPMRPPPPPPILNNNDSTTTKVDDVSDSDQEQETTTEYIESETSKQQKERQQKALQDLLMKRRAAALAVPTNDKAVRARLRRLGEPITLFGEREMERRDRLRMLMAKLDSQGQLEKLMIAHEEDVLASAGAEDPGDEEVVEYPFYTEGSEELLDARIEITKYSVVKAGFRVQRERRKREDPDEDVDAEIDWVLKQAGSFVLDCSEIGDDRPLSGCSFSNDGQLLATW